MLTRKACSNKGDEAGTFCINTVGENLVAMTLPGDGNSGTKRQKKPATKRTAVKSAKRVAAKKKA